MLPLSYDLIFVSYIRGTGERQIFLRYLRIVLLVLVMALLAIGEHRHCLPDADIGSVRCAPCVLICLEEAATCSPVPAIYCNQDTCRYLYTTEGK